MPQSQPLTEDETARAVQRGIRSETTKRYLGCFVVLLCCVSAAIVATVLPMVTHNTLVIVVAVIIGFLAPGVLLGKHLR